MSTRKYFWLKLKKDFFKRHDIRIIESQPNGKDYVLFYLKLMCEATSHNGQLRFSDYIPYNEDMLATITNTNVDVVRQAIKIFGDLKMVEILDDGTIYLNEVEKLIGSETGEAQRKREYRKSLKRDNVPKLSQSCPTDIEIDKEKELDQKLDIIKSRNVEAGCCTQEKAEEIAAMMIQAFHKTNTSPRIDDLQDYFSKILEDRNIYKPLAYLIECFKGAAHEE